jgi:hypothetical protein
MVMDTARWSGPDRSWPDHVDARLPLVAREALLEVRDLRASRLIAEAPDGSPAVEQAGSGGSRCLRRLPIGAG